MTKQDPQNELLQALGKEASEKLSRDMQIAFAVYENSLMSIRAKRAWQVRKAKKEAKQTTH